MKSGDQPGNDIREPSGALKVFSLDCGDVYMVYTFVKTHRPELLKWVNFIIFKLYLYNVDFLKKREWGNALVQRSFF